MPVLAATARRENASQPGLNSSRCRIIQAVMRSTSGMSALQTRVSDTYSRRIRDPNAKSGGQSAKTVAFGPGSKHKPLLLRHLGELLQRIHSHTRPSSSCAIRAASCLVRKAPVIKRMTFSARDRPRQAADPLPADHAESFCEFTLAQYLGSLPALFQMAGVPLYCSIAGTARGRPSSPT